MITEECEKFPTININNVIWKSKYTKAKHMLDELESEFMFGVRKYFKEYKTDEIRTLIESKDELNCSLAIEILKTYM